MTFRRKDLLIRLDRVKGVFRSKANDESAWKNNEALAKWVRQKPIMLDNAGPSLERACMYPGPTDCLDHFITDGG